MVKKAATKEKEVTNTKEPKPKSRFTWFRIVVLSVIIFISSLVVTYMQRKEISKHLDPHLPVQFRREAVERAVQEAWLLTQAQLLTVPAQLQGLIEDSAFKDLMLNSTLLQQFSGNQTKNPDLLEDFEAGHSARMEGIRLKHPVVLIPGIVASSLEAWSTEASPCGQRYFRKKIWGGFSMLQTLLLDKECWKSYMALDPSTGLDPPQIKLRATSGFEAVDYFIPGYWLMSKLISNIAAIGGDTNTLNVEAYDWRLNFHNLEIRDKYFTKLKMTIEVLYLQGGEEKVVMVCHSMGNKVMLFFLSWVQSELGGRGGKYWPGKYLKAWVNIAGPLLGVTKSLAPMLSGETRDTAVLHDTFGSQLVERFLNRTERIVIFHTFGGVANLFPNGGARIWGLDTNTSTTAAFALRVGDSMEFVNLGVEQMIERVYEVVGETIAKRWKAAFNLDEFEEEEESNEEDYLMKPRNWINPLLSPLPSFPSEDFKIYCIYGHGHSTERAYYYRYNESSSSPLENYQIDKDFSNISEGGSVVNGVENVDGDGSVPLLSLGYMCLEGWKAGSPLNPSNVSVITKEYARPETFAASSLIRTADGVDHVDIQGNTEVLKDILHIVGGRDNAVKTRISSGIMEILKRVNGRIDI